MWQPPARIYYIFKKAGSEHKNNMGVERLTMSSQSLIAFIGGYTGPSYRIEKAGDVIKYIAWEYGYSNPKEIIVEPTSKQWESFWKVCKDIGVDTWATKYPNPGICDGTSWEIKIHSEHFSASSSGDNSFPDDDDPEYADYKKRYGYSRPFRRTLLAIRRLIGGLSFQ